MRGAGDYRPMPADFADNAWLGQRALQAMYGAGQKTIARWRSEMGGEDPRLSLFAAPVDLAERAKTMTKMAMCRHYGVGRDRMRSWIKSLTEPPKTREPRVRRPVPDDFAEVCPTMTVTALMAHYTADRRTVQRWCEAAGLSAAERTWTTPPPRRPRNFEFRGHAGLLVLRDMRQFSMYDEAADVIRRERFVVHRCDERGRYDEKGGFWRIGNSLLTPDELLQRADKYRKSAA